MPSEFDLIERFFRRPAPGAVLGVGDDCALMQVGAGMDLAVSADMLVEGRHFFAGADPFRLGHKALAVNLSDMAAMGATPRWATLALALPDACPDWLAPFSEGLFALAAAFGVDVVGGDTTRGPRNICIQIMGEIPRGEALRRDGAKVDDDVWVSGELGGAALALAHLKGQIRLDPADFDHCRARLEAPAPRVAVGIALRRIARSAIDISDGLVGDLGHIAERSRLGAVVELARLPRSLALERWRDHPVARHALLAGGDDYELCFTASPAMRGPVGEAADAAGVPLTRIGRMQAGSGVAVLDADGCPLPLEKSFDHFG